MYHVIFKCSAQISNKTLRIRKTMSHFIETFMDDFDHADNVLDALQLQATKNRESARGKGV